MSRIRPWIWTHPQQGSTSSAPELAVPALPTFTESDPVERGRILGPKGEVLRVAYDRRVQPFGFTRRDDR